MTVAQVQIRMTRDGDLAEDTTTNTLYFESIDTPLLESDCADIAATINLFYGAFDQYLATTINPSLCTMRFYDMADPSPRIPVSEEPLTITPGTATPTLPAEVAACLSFRAEISSGDDRARRSGRIYLGPFTTGVLEIGTQDCRVSSTFAGFVNTGVGFLKTPVDNGGRIWTWSVFSPSTNADNGGSNPNLAAWPVASYWMDNAFDTQRRRGTKPTARVINGTV